MHKEMKQPQLRSNPPDHTAGRERNLVTACRIRGPLLDTSRGWAYLSRRQFDAAFKVHYTIIDAQLDDGAMFAAHDHEGKKRKKKKKTNNGKRNRYQPDDCRDGGPVIVAMRRAEPLTIATAGPADRLSCLVVSCLEKGAQGQDTRFPRPQSPVSTPPALACYLGSDAFRRLSLSSMNAVSKHDAHSPATAYVPRSFPYLVGKRDRAEGLICPFHWVRAIKVTFAPISQWLCRVSSVLKRSIQPPKFPESWNYAWNTPDEAQSWYGKASFVCRRPPLP